MILVIFFLLVSPQHFQYVIKLNVSEVLWCDKFSPFSNNVINWLCGQMTWWKHNLTSYSVVTNLKNTTFIHGEEQIPVRLTQALQFPLLALLLEGMAETCILIKLMHCISWFNQLLPKYSSMHFSFLFKSLTHIRTPRKWTK